MKLIDIVGQRFGRLVVRKKAETRASGGSLWRCECDCGTFKIVNSSALRGGTTRSCGCLAKEWASKMGATPEFVAKRAEKTVVHGHKRRSSKTPEYHTWLSIKRRCYEPTYKDYPNWGGKGVRMSEEWRSSFVAFLRDMGRRPSATHSIDRIDGKDHYCAENCRWATPQQQGANRINVVPVTVNGITFESRQAACLHFGVLPTTANERIKAGIQLEIAVSHVGPLPPRRSRESYLRKSMR